MPCAFHAPRPPEFEDLEVGCQFNVPERELISLGGTLFCPFHLPVRLPNGPGSGKDQWDISKINDFNRKISAYIGSILPAGGCIDLTGVVFPGAVTFSNIFQNNVAVPDILFRRAQFLGFAGFEDMTFGKTADFEDCQFHNLHPGEGSANFGGVAFKDRVNFLGAEFRGPVNFKGAIFEEFASFGGVKFVVQNKIYLDADFSDSEFKEFVDFGGARFSGTSRFSEAKFGDYALFENVIFGEGVDFHNTEFQSIADFKVLNRTESADAENTDMPRAIFSGCRFSGPAFFSNRYFSAGADFSKANFMMAPHFHGCTLHPDTDFSETAFQDTGSQWAVRAYRTLKLAMENLRARNEEAMFYALEQKSLRKQSDTPFMAKVLSRAYEFGSNYGRSMGLPLVWLVTLVVFCGAEYAILAGQHTPPDMGRAFLFAFDQMVRPFSALTSIYAERAGDWAQVLLATHPVAVRLLAGMQSAAGLGLLTLFVLAVRRRFKMG